MTKSVVGTTPVGLARPRTGGSRKLTYEDGFDMSVRLFDALEKLENLRDAGEREATEGEICWMRAKITPPARMAAATFHAAVIREARSWIGAHGGMPNIGAFIDYFRTLPTSERRYAGKSCAHRAQGNAIRHILKTRLNIAGRRGRPKTKAMTAAIFGED